MKVMVIGAGLSGLAAAWRLQEQGLDVEVLEASSRPGGRCCVLRRHGFLIDMCPEIAAASYLRFFALAGSAGLSGDIVTCSPVVSSMRDGRMIDIDTRKLSSIAFTPLLSWWSKFRLAAGLARNFPLIKKANAFKLGDLAELDEPDSSAEDFSVKAFGREAADYLIDPLMRTLGGSEMGKVSKLTALGGVNSWASSMVTILGGLYRVPEGIAAKLQVRYNSPVTHVAEHAAGVSISYRDADGQNQTLAADRCIIAAQYNDAERMFPGLAQYAEDFGAHLKFCRLIDLKLAYTIATNSKAYVAQVATREDKELMMFTLSHNKAPDRVPAGHSLFTLYTDDAVWDRFAEMPDEAIVEWGRQKMETLYPELRGHFLFADVGRQPRTAYFASPGFYRRTTALFAGLAPSRVQLAGDLFGAGSMEAAVVWGEKAADRIVLQMKAGAASASMLKAA